MTTILKSNPPLTLLKIPVKLEGYFTPAIESG